MKKFDHYCSNLAVLATAETVLERESWDETGVEFVIGGIIDKFSIQFELGWKVLKELLKYEGRREAGSDSPRDIIKSAYAVYDFMDETVWLSMLRTRSNLAHIYDGNEAKRLVDVIIQNYIPEFLRMRDCIAQRYTDFLDEL